MASPTFSRAAHDVGIGGKGYVTPPGGRVVRQDAVAPLSRNAIGEGRYDLWQADSFYAQATFSGGAGQSRLLSTDSYLSGVCDSRWQGAVFPARKLISAASSGGTTAFMFHRDAKVYGFGNSGIEEIGTSTAFATGGVVPRHQPVVDGNGDVFYVSTSNALMKWTGSGTPSTITTNLGTGVTPYVVANWHRYLWCLGTRNYESSPTLVQSASKSGGERVHTFKLDRQPVVGNLLVLAFAVDGTALVDVVEGGWVLAQSQTTSGAIRTWLYYKVAEPFDKGVGKMHLSTEADVSIVVAEFEGMDPNGILDVSNQDTATAATAVSPGPITTTEADALVIALHAGDNATAMAPAAGYTEIGEEFTNGVRMALSYKVLTSTGTEDPAFTSTTSGTLSATIAAFKGNTLAADSTQFAMYYSRDGGASWALVFPDMSTGIEPPVAAVGAGGFLWFTTARGLYQVGIDDTEYLDGEDRINIFLRGKLDTFARSSATPATGRTPDNFTAGWLAYWEGALFYPVGQTLRSFPIGGMEGRQVWPTSDWGTVGGDLKAVTAGEGGVYFAAGTILWNYNGRGFHPLATSATSGIYDYLYWHDGKLYVKADSAQYYDFGYPSLRPDIFSTAATNFETGYVITSMIDFEKVDTFKHISAFQSFATFSATTNSGTITWAYRSADTGEAPDRYGGGATSLSWTTLGTHDVTDGNTKTISISTIKAKAIWLRATIAPGASGYPIIRAPFLSARSVMPTLKRFVCDIQISSNLKNKAGAMLYATPTDAWTALEELNALRDGTDTFTLTYLEPDGGTSAYTCTADQMQDSANDWKKVTVGVDGTLQFIALQLPGTSVTKLSPSGVSR